MLDRIAFEENTERLKIIIPLQRQMVYWSTYTLLLVTWIAGSIWAAIQVGSFIATGNFGFEGIFLIAYFVILALIAIFWFYVGRMVWRQWQYHSSNREILFFHPDKLIVRRPLSLLGITEAYDRKFVSRFRFDERVRSPAFNYGTYRVPVGVTLDEETSRALVREINDRCFGGARDDDDDDDD